MNQKLIEALGLDAKDFEPNEPNDRFLDLESNIEYNIMVGNLEDPSTEVNDDDE